MLHKAKLQVVVELDIYKVRELNSNSIISIFIVEQAGPS